MPIDGLYEDDVRAELAAMDALDLLYRTLGADAAIRGDDTEAGLILEAQIRLFQARQALLPHTQLMNAEAVSAAMH
jgi:hypothetical protein